MRAVTVFGAVTQFDLTYRGASVEDGSIDARDLAPALLAASGLARTAQQVLLADGPAVSVRVVSTRTGSFVLSLEFAEFIDRAVSFFASEPGAALRNLSGTIAGVITIILKLRGRRPVEVIDEPSSNTVILVLEDERFEITRDEYRLLQDKKFRQHIEVLTDPVEREGYDELEIRHDETDHVVVVNKSNRSAFEAPVPAAEIVTDETFSENLNLHTIRVESRSWMFRRQDGTVIHARIEDDEFWAEFISDRVDVVAGSIIRARLHHLQTIELDGTLQTRWSVLRVIDVMPPDLDQYGQTPSMLPKESEAGPGEEE